MKIITYNINGIRAVLRKDFLSWLKAADPDVLCLQELKANEDQFDKGLFEEMGYHFYMFPAEKKGYSGVGILCKEKPKDIAFGCGIEKYDVEGRMIRCDFEDFSVMSTYMPSGASKIERQVFKMHWLHDFYDYIDDVRAEHSNLIIGGDFNLCHRAIDIHDPYRLDGYPGFTPEERAWMTGFLDKGYADAFREMNNQAHQYSWWSYRSGARQKNLGWRIDYLLIPENMRNQLQKSRHLTDAVHSDHCPVLIEMTFN